ncbi:MAG TPA: hypothetical protein VF131_17980 [Blastocatellia bacterium]|nr:hypothetical protein [Blastocatellia bacterium]
MAKAYFINATPTNVKAVLNGGDQHKLAPISVNGTGTAVTGTAWGATISAFVSPDGFSGDGKENELLFSSEQSGTTRKYTITSKVSTVQDLYFFMFEDSIVGEDNTGASNKITITKQPNLSTSLFDEE